jgi:hypothetical protein
MRIYPSLLSLLKKSIRIRKITILQPSFFLYRSRAGSFVGPWVAMKKKEEKEEVPEGEEVSGKEEKKKGEPIPIEINRIRIRKGSIDFEDRKVGEPPAQIRLREFDFEIRDIQYPLTSSPSPVELKGKMVGRKREGSFYTKGWIDLKTMDLETSLKIREIEVEALKPYYRKRVSAEIDSGYLDMESKIAAKEKRMDASGAVDLMDLHIKGGGGTIFWIPAETIVPLLEQKKSGIKVPFHLRGNLGDPQFNLRETFLAQIAVSFAEALGLPIKSVGQSLFGETGKETEGLVEGFKSIQRMFKKKKEKKR